MEIMLDPRRAMWVSSSTREEDVTCKVPITQGRSEGPLSDVFCPWVRWEGGLARRWSSSGCGGGGTVGGAARCHFLEKQKVNVPTSPGWIWAKNMGLGKLGVINSQKFLPSGLKLQADILTRSE